jgi:hypothetical protein
MHFFLYRLACRCSGGTIPDETELVQSLDTSLWHLFGLVLRLLVFFFYETELVQSLDTSLWHLFGLVLRLLVLFT